MVEGRINQTHPGTGGSPQIIGQSIFQQVERHFWKQMFSGFLVLIPLMVTFLVLRFVFNSVDGIFRPLVRETILDFPGIGIAFSLVLLYVTGLLVASRAGRKALDWQSFILGKIPVVKSIYSIAKQTTDALSSPAGQYFSRVVFVEWPHKGLRSLAFVTGQCYVPDEHGEPMVVVYIPTVPTPTSGILALVRKEDVIETNISMEDAMKMVFTCGVVLPNMLTNSAGVGVYNVANIPPPAPETKGA